MALNELFLYDKERGLFKAILDKSTVIAGRYHIMVSSGDLNTANIGAYLSDPLNGLQGVPQKYPLCLCLPPRSASDDFSETLAFTMYFLTRDKATGQNQLKNINTQQQVSTHQVWEDWKDMSEVANNFLYKLNWTIRHDSSGDVKLSSVITLQKEGQSVDRISQIGNDKLNGVRLSFRMSMVGLLCTTTDYPINAPIVIPDINIHPLHKH